MDKNIEAINPNSDAVLDNIETLVQCLLHNVASDRVGFGYFADA